MASGDEALDTRASLIGRLHNPADHDSWRTFLAVYEPVIVGYCRRLGLQEADAADVAQEVLSNIVQAMRTFAYDPARGRFRDWLRTAVRHRVGRFFKVEAERPTTASLDALPAAAQDGAWDEAFNANVLRTALERTRPQFEPVTWQAFWLTWQEPLPPATVAAQLGIGIDSVYVAKSRVLKRLRAEMSDLSDDWPILPDSASPGE